MKRFLILTFFIFSNTILFSSIDSQEHIYICTGANSKYFKALLNFIGSLHKVNYHALKEIMVFNFGLSAQEVKKLEKIDKLVVCDLDKTHPKMLDYFSLPNGGRVFGWFAWKPVSIHQALKKYPHVIWMDAGTTVLRPIDDLMHHVVENGYFIVTIGNEFENGKFRHPLEWGTTKFVRDKFELNKPENQWILSQEFVMGGLNGVSRDAYDLFLKDWYEASYDLKNFADDGTTPNGWGTGRHDQTYLSILAYIKGLHICKQDYTQKVPTILNVNGQQVSLYITWHPQYVCEKTHIYNSRGALGDYERFIKYK